MLDHGEAVLNRRQGTSHLSSTLACADPAATEDSLSDHQVTITRNVTMRCKVCGARFAALRRSKKTCSPACRQRLSRRLRAATPPLPSGSFDLVVADPPWQFETFSERGLGKSPERHYST